MSVANYFTLEEFFKVEEPKLNDGESLVILFVVVVQSGYFLEIIGWPAPSGFFLGWNHSSFDILIVVFDFAMSTECRV